jgi:hypothetical protein
MPHNLYEVLTFDRKGGADGTLTMFQEGEGLPFPIKKVLVVTDVDQTAVRGKHAHKTVQEIVVAIKGGCMVEVTDGTHTASEVLDSPTKAILLPGPVWRTLKDFQPDTILLIIADGVYDENDYLRDYDEFLAFVGKK